MTTTTTTGEPGALTRIFFLCLVSSWLLRCARSSSFPPSPSGTITFPLIPHHVQRSRRLANIDTDTELFSREKEVERNYNRRRRRRGAESTTTASNPQQMGALYQGYGTHYVDLWCGSPPQRQTVIVDTGSGLTAYPCSSCKDCGSPEHHIDAYFEEDNSSTFKKSDCSECPQRAVCNPSLQHCQIDMSYSEGSTWTAYEAMDSCYIGGYHNAAITDVSLACVASYRIVYDTNTAFFYPSR